MVLLKYINLGACAPFGLVKKCNLNRLILCITSVLFVLLSHVRWMSLATPSNFPMWSSENDNQPYYVILQWHRTFKSQSPQGHIDALIKHLLALITNIRSLHVAFSVSRFPSLMELYTNSGSSHFISLSRLHNLHTEYCATDTDMSHSNLEQVASTAMQSARSRLLELPTEASI